MSKLYGVLGVASDASEKEITKAFRAKARKLHPDKQPPSASDADKARACKAFQELVGAYEVLSDETKRRRHDLERPDSAPAASQRPRPPSRQQPSSASSNRRQEDDFSGGGYGAPPPRGARGDGCAPPPRASGGARRYAPQSEDSDSDENPRNWRPPKKTPQEEEDDKDARRRREQAERDKVFEGLGSHWVKPPPRSSSASKRSSDVPKAKPKPKSAPTQTRAEPMPKTKAKRETPEEDQKPPGEKKKRGSKGSKSDGDESDCSSDASSVLSFDIRIDLKKYKFILEPEEEGLDPFNATEVWTITQPAAKKETWAPVGPAVEDAPGETGKDKEDPLKPGKPSPSAAQKRCCAMQ